MVATWFDLSPRTTPPFQTTKMVNVMRREMYGQSRAIRRMGLVSAEIARLRRARMGSDSVSLVKNKRRGGIPGGVAAESGGLCNCPIEDCSCKEETWFIQ